MLRTTGSGGQRRGSCCERGMMSASAALRGAVWRQGLARAGKRPAAAAAAGSMPAAVLLGSSHRPCAFAANMQRRASFSSQPRSARLPVWEGSACHMGRALRSVGWRPSCCCYYCCYCDDDSDDGDGDDNHRCCVLFSPGCRVDPNVVPPPQPASTPLPPLRRPLPPAPSTPAVQPPHEVRC